MSFNDKAKPGATRRAFVRDASLGAAGMGILGSLGAVAEEPKNAGAIPPSTNITPAGDLDRLDRLEKMVQRSLDLIEIQNVMSKMTFYHAANLQLEALEKLWAINTPGVAYEADMGRYEGIKALRALHVTDHKMLGVAFRKEMVKLFPGRVEDDPKNDYVGKLVVHPLTTPVLVIADDGETAKGVWYTTGLLTTFVGAMWHYGRAAADFVKEDGAWKVWHLRIYKDFLSPYEQSWYDNAMNPEVSAEKEHMITSALPPGEMPFDARPNAPASQPVYQPYSPFRVAQFEPRLPEPYKTFKETFSY